MHHIVFGDSTSLMKDYVARAAEKHGLDVIRVEVTKSVTFGDVVEIVMENDNRSAWKQLFSEFPVLAEGELTLD